MFGFRFRVQYRICLVEHPVSLLIQMRLWLLGLPYRWVVPAFAVALHWSGVEFVSAPFTPLHINVHFFVCTCVLLAVTRKIFFSCYEVLLGVEFQLSEHDLLDFPPQLVFFKELLNMSWFVSFSVPGWCVGWWCYRRASARCHSSLTGHWDVGRSVH